MFSNILKLDPYHDKAGKFTHGFGGAGDADASNLSALANIKSPTKVTDLIPAEIRNATNTKPLNDFIKGTGFTIKYPHPDDNGVTGDSLDLTKNTSATKGFKLAVSLTKDVVQHLPPDVQESLKKLNPTLLASSIRTANGKAWINQRSMAVNVTRLAKSCGGAVGSFNEEKTKALQGNNYTISAADFKDYDGKNGAEVASKIMKSTITHEIGHLLTSDATVIKAKSLLDSKGLAAELWTKKNISEYATYNVKEFVAESFSKFHNKNYLPGSMPPAWEAMVKEMPQEKMKNMGALTITKSNDTFTPLKRMWGFGSPEWYGDDSEEDTPPKYKSMLK